MSPFQLTEEQKQLHDEILERYRNLKRSCKVKSIIEETENALQDRFIKDFRCKTDKDFLKAMGGKNCADVFGYQISVFLRGVVLQVFPQGDLFTNISDRGMNGTHGVFTLNSMTGFDDFTNKGDCKPSHMLDENTFIGFAKFYKKNRFSVHKLVNEHGGRNPVIPFTFGRLDLALDNDKVDTMNARPEVKEEIKSRLRRYLAIARAMKAQDEEERHITESVCKTLGVDVPKSKDCGVVHIVLETNELPDTSIFYGFKFDVYENDQQFDDFFKDLMETVSFIRMGLNEQNNIVVKFCDAFCPLNCYRDIACDNVSKNNNIVFHFRGTRVLEAKKQSPRMARVIATAKERMKKNALPPKFTTEKVTDTSAKGQSEKKELTKKRETSKSLSSSQIEGSNPSNEGESISDEESDFGEDEYSRIDLQDRVSTIKLPEGIFTFNREKATAQAHEETSRRQLEQSSTTVAGASKEGLYSTVTKVRKPDAKTEKAFVPSGGALPSTSGVVTTGEANQEQKHSEELTTPKQESQGLFARMKQGVQSKLLDLNFIPISTGWFSAPVKDLGEAEKGELLSEDEEFLSLTSSPEEGARLLSPRSMVTSPEVFFLAPSSLEEGVVRVGETKINVLQEEHVANGQPASRSVTQVQERQCIYRNAAEEREASERSLEEANMSVEDEELAHSSDDHASVSSEAPETQLSTIIEENIEAVDQELRQERAVLSSLDLVLKRVEDVSAKSSLASMPVLEELIRGQKLSACGSYSVLAYYHKGEETDCKLTNDAVRDVAKSVLTSFDERRAEQQKEERKQEIHSISHSSAHSSSQRSGGPTFF